jgi:predicted RNA binding protein YcfA (HicA-like mRNA interferase family)
MTQIPVIAFKAMDKALSRLGFSAIRQRGSHVFYRHPDGRVTIVPNHPGRDLSRPLVREILREIELTPDRFLEILKSL